MTLWVCVSAYLPSYPLVCKWRVRVHVHVFGVFFWGDEGIQRDQRNWWDSVVFMMAVVRGRRHSWSTHSRSGGGLAVSRPRYHFDSWHGWLPQKAGHGRMDVLALRFVHRDRITQPEWKLSPFDGHSTPGKVWNGVNTMRGITSSLPSGMVSTVTSLRPMALTITLVLFIRWSWTEMLHISMHRQLGFNFSSWSGTPGDFRDVRNSSVFEIECKLYDGRVPPHCSLVFQPEVLHLLLPKYSLEWSFWKLFLNLLRQVCCELG